ncbi:leucyl/phenylalanyl-tRNA--protein transferase [Pseudovibrio sp. SPO723]|uniref:leucyl/phenylalanyl-tRNA--protein transferase n=1 Tax=Nesiotobacter zosterae TaxID=392721 RepID=UPI0029C2E53E|nr:leucyl/phenylalanyl-tRNA--protein transferase [Pseudovibrio sp. SPO723]MDX5592673.1 leucyl/phenylalanyl-tRNA--protein transferase [Pseudovibrio sp. SPO723]
MAARHDHVHLEITPHVLLKAYACGVFPMAESADDPDLFWVEPERRGIIPLEGFHVPKRLRRTVKSDRFKVIASQDFQGVIDGCASPAPGRKRTWINAEIRRLYCELFKMGYCHTVEVYENDKLVGGLYGVCLASVFFGESMFSTARDVSKIALVHLVARMKAGGFTLLDTQFVTDHLQQFGALEIPRDVYNELLDTALQEPANFFSEPSQITGARALELIDSPY